MTALSLSLLSPSSSSSANDRLWRCSTASVHFALAWQRTAAASHRIGGHYSPLMPLASPRPTLATLSPLLLVRLSSADCAGEDRKEMRLLCVAAVLALAACAAADYNTEAHKGMDCKDRGWSSRCFRSSISLSLSSAFSHSLALPSFCDMHCCVSYACAQGRRKRTETETMEEKERRSVSARLSSLPLRPQLRANRYSSNALPKAEGEEG